MFEVYVITNLVNGKQYVGKARNARKRWWDHCVRATYGSTQAVHCAIRKYGRGAFVVEVLERVADEAGAFEAERRHIARLRTTEVGYNMTAGGEGCSGYRHTPESLKKMGDVHRGVPNTEEQKQKIAATLRNRIYLPEWAAKISESKTGHKVSEETRTKIAAKLRGRKRTPEEMVNVNAANRARNGPRRPRTSEERANIAMALKGKPWTEKRRAACKRRTAEPIQMELF